MKKTWTVYAIFVDGRQEYIGHARDICARKSHHKAQLFCDVDFQMIVLKVMPTKAAAEKLEARLIRKHKPPRNKVFAGHRPFSYVATQRQSGIGWVPTRFKLSEGMMHPDEAKKIWLSADARKDREIISSMPGWTMARARHMFGPRNVSRTGPARVGEPEAQEVV